MLGVVEATHEILERISSGDTLSRRVCARALMFRVPCWRRRGELPAALADRVLRGRGVELGETEVESSAEGSSLLGDPFLFESATAWRETSQISHFSWAGILPDSAATKR